MMKTLYMIGGTMGVGKTTVCQQLKQDLQNSVFIDGDWCWEFSAGLCMSSVLSIQLLKS